MDDANRVIDELGLTTMQVCDLAAHDRRRLLSFLLRWEQFDALHACLDLLIPRNPSLVSLCDVRARAFLAQDRLDEALKVVEERIRRKTSLPVRARLARTHLARGDVAVAREIAQRLLDEANESAMAWGLMGEVEVASGDMDAALSAYGQLHDLYPNSRAYLWGMATIHSLEGDWVTASGYAVQLLQLGREGSPLSVAYHRRLRDYFEASGESTRVDEIEAELTRRHAEELAELRARLSPRQRQRSSSRPSSGEETRVARRESVERLPSYDSVPVSDVERREITDAVRRLFGFASLLPGQLETMACVLRGEDVLTILPTGGGKSLCYQLPATAESLALGSDEGADDVGRGVTLVISPLIALMKDQVDSLPRAVRQRATAINSTIGRDELRRRLDRIGHGVYRLVYAAPERLRQPPFLHALCRAGVERLVIDEAHCVSMWGHDFRPEYLIIGQTRKDLGNPPLLAMTATAPLRVRHDILQRLGDPRDTAERPRIVAGDLTRSNLQLEVLHARDNDEKLRHLLAFCRAETGSGIVYADTRARCEELAALLHQHGVNATYYHAGIAERHRVQDDFMAGRSRVVVATIAFGMGIDKPDIRFIVHFFPPASLESYYQEAGRAGRDGLPARCLLMYSSHDRGLLTRRSRRDVLPVEFLREVYAAAKTRLNGRQKGRVAMADLERDLRTDESRIRVALSLLEEAGLLRRGPDLPRAALVCLAADCQERAMPDDLATFRRAARLRPQQWLTLDLAVVAPECGIPLTEIEAKILTWEDAGWLRYRPAGRDLLLHLPPPPADAAEQMRMLLEQHEAIQSQRVDEISSYAATTHCRHGRLNAYLGGRTIGRCAACDNCIEVPSPPDPGLPDEKTQWLTLLRCVENAPWGWGQQTLVRILRGDLRPRPRARPLREEARRQAEFGALSFRSKTAIRRMVERLGCAGLLAARDLEHGGSVYDLTAKGRRALQDPGMLNALYTRDEPAGSARAIEQSSREEVEELDGDEALFQVLRAWRLEQARERNLPPFVIFHDSHLRAMAACKPTSLSALSEVKGIGPKRLETHGAALIDLIRRYLESDAGQTGNTRG